MAAATEKLRSIKAKVAVSTYPKKLKIKLYNQYISIYEIIICSFLSQSLEEKLATLTADFEKATAEKMKCQKEADATNATIQLANRLVNGLASENVRWAEAVSR